MPGWGREQVHAIERGWGNGWVDWGVRRIGRPIPGIIVYKYSNTILSSEGKPRSQLPPPLHTQKKVTPLSLIDRWKLFQIVHYPFHTNICVCVSSIQVFTHIQASPNKQPFFKVASFVGWESLSSLDKDLCMGFLEGVPRLSSCTLLIVWRQWAI